MRKIVFISAVIKAYSMPTSVDNNSDQNKIRKISLEYTLCTLYTASPSMLYAGHNIIYLWMTVDAAAAEETWIIYPWAMEIKYRNTIKKIIFCS